MKKPINVNTPPPQENLRQLGYKMVCKFINLINQLTLLLLSQYQPFNMEKYKRK